MRIKSGFRFAQQGVAAKMCDATADASTKHCWLPNKKTPTQKWVLTMIEMI
jgi:hypothetical protein